MERVRFTMWAIEDGANESQLPTSACVRSRFSFPKYPPAVKARGYEQRIRTIMLSWAERNSIIGIIHPTQPETPTRGPACGRSRPCVFFVFDWVSAPYSES